MVGDVRPGALLVVAAGEPLAHPLPTVVQEGAVDMAVLPPRVARREQHQREDVPPLERHAPVHVRFAQLQARVAGEVPGHFAVGEADGDGLELGIGPAVAAARPVCLDDGQLALLDHAAKGLVQQRHDDVSFSTPARGGARPHSLFPPWPFDNSLC